MPSNDISEKSLKNTLLEAYCAGKTLAKDVCWAMARSPVCEQVEVEDIKDYGWLISCYVLDRKLALGNLEAILKKKKFNKIDWL